MEANPNKVPLVTIKGVTPEKGKFGTNYRPDLSVSKWVERPDGMPDQPASGELPIVGNGTGAAHQAAPEPIANTGVEF